jgi:hypothetical protein
MGNQTNTFSVVGFENVAVNNITYRRCLHLHCESNTGDTLDNWKAPWIGDIKSVQTSSSGASETSVLKEYKPGN